MFLLYINYLVFENIFLKKTSKFNKKPYILLKIYNRKLFFRKD